MNKVLLLILSCCLSSCAMDYKMPSNRFESPETVGEKGKLAFTGVGHGESIEVTPDFSSKWGGDAANHSIGYERFFTVGGYFGVFPNSDVGIKYVSDEGIVGSMKWQFAGNNSDKGFKGALVGNLGFGTESKEENNHTPSKAELSNAVVGLDLILGYRFGKSFLLYVGGFYDSASYTLKQKRGTTEQTFEDDSINEGGTAGLIFSINKSSSLQFEYARNSARYNDLHKSHDNLGGRLNIAF